MKALGFLFGILATTVAMASQAQGHSKCSDSLLKKALTQSGIIDDGRIAGGVNVLLDDNPWQVALVKAKDGSNRSAQYCGGVMVHKDWVLTAAHCVASADDMADLAVLSGTSSLESEGKRSKVLAVRPHELFRKDESSDCYNYDIALLKIDSMQTPLAGKSIDIAQINLESKGGALVRVSGWGATENIFVRTTKLQAGEVPLVPMSVCNSSASYDNRVRPSTMFCAGFTDGRTDPCKGDSGGPATMIVDGSRKLVGLVSWGDGCATPNLYGVYTDVTKLAEWVKATSGGAVGGSKAGDK